MSVDSLYSNNGTLVMIVIRLHQVFLTMYIYAYGNKF